MRRHLLALMLAILACGLPGQQRIGATYRVGSSVASRGALLANRGVVITRFDRDEVRGWGMDPAHPGMHVVTGLSVLCEDADGSTPDACSLLVYRENPTAPGFPDVANPLLATGSIPLPPAAAGPAAFFVVVGLSPPLLIPAGSDVFVGVQLGPAPSWPVDGLAVGTLLGHLSRWPVYDAPGPATIQHGGYGLYSDPATSTLNYNTRRQLVVDLLTADPGGAATAKTNQASYPPSNSSPGTGGFLSALHPDARAVPLNPLRADEIGFVYLDSAMPDGIPVLFLGDFGNFGPETLLASLAPGSKGAICLNAATVQSIGVGFLASGEASHMIPIPPALRGSLAGVLLLQQAVGFDAATNSLRASPCALQVF